MSDEKVDVTAEQNGVTLKLSWKMVSIIITALVTAIFGGVGNFFNSESNFEQAQKVNEATFMLLQEQIRHLVEDVDELKTDMRALLGRPEVKTSEAKPSRAPSSVSMALVGEPVALDDSAPPILQDKGFAKAASKVKFSDIVQQVREEGNADLNKIIGKKLAPEFPPDGGSGDGG